MTTVLALPQGTDQLYCTDGLDKVREEQRDSNEKDMSMVITTDDQIGEKL